MTPPTPPQLDLTNPPSPKVIAASVAALVVPAISAALLYLQTDQGAQLYAALPVVLVVLVRALITGLVTWIAAYRVADPQRILDLAASPKVVFATLGAVAVQAIVDVIVYLTGPDAGGLYASWPPIAVVALQAVLPALAAGLLGWLKVDPARYTSDNQTPKATLPPSAVPQAAPAYQHDDGNLAVD